MTAIAQTTRPGVSFVAVAALLAGGLAATLVWETFARGIAPAMIGGPLQPAGLVSSVFSKLGVWELFGVAGPDRGAIAEVAHLATGVLFYPLAYVLIARPISRAFPHPLSGWLLVGAVYGAVLFAFALYAMAHLIAGFPPFLGWLGVIDQVAQGAAPASRAFFHIGAASLLGHVAYGIALAAVVRAVSGR